MDNIDNVVSCCPHCGEIAPFYQSNDSVKEIECICGKNYWLVELVHRKTFISVNKEELDKKRLLWIEGVHNCLQTL